MNIKYLKFLLPVALVIAVISSMIGTRSVLADEAPPTSTEEAPTEETSSTEEPGETPEAGNAEPPVPSTEEPLAPGESSEALAEIMEQIPAETALIVLNESGEVLPLVSTEAQNLIIAGDPQWCMAGHTPADDPLGGTFCTAKFTKFNGVGGLIEELTNGSGIDAGAGTIFIAHDYNAATAGDAGTNIIFDYGATGLGLTSLVVQGGWDFAQNKVIGTSTIELGMTNYVAFYDWGGYGIPGSLTLKDLIIKNSEGLYIEDSSDITTADVTLDNVTVTNTEFGTYIETDGNVNVNKSTFTQTKSETGLIVYNVGNITLTSVYASQNYYEGADLDNTCGCSNGNIFVSDSVFDTNGSSSDGRGLIAHSNGNITLNNVSANGNGGGGAELINCFFDLLGTMTCQNTNIAKITLTGKNTFNNNGYNPNFMGGFPASVGLWIGANGDVSVDGVTVTGNGAGIIGGGAFIFTENGSMSITNSAFDNNCTVTWCDGLGIGLMAVDLYGSSVTINNISANGNGNGNGSFNSSSGGGMLLLNFTGNTFITNSTFNGNCTTGTCVGGGMQVLSGGNVYLNNVTASNNGLLPLSGGGAYIMSSSNVDIYCSTFSNEGSGLQIETQAGKTATLNGVIFSGNTENLISLGSGTVSVNPFDCVPVTTKGSSTKANNLPLQVVNVGEGSGANLDCASYSGTKLVLENGDHIIVPCPLNGSANLTGQGSTGLPSALPSGSTFRSGFVTSISDGSSADGKFNASVLVSFVIPDGVDASSLAILFWDGTQWTELDNTFTFTENGKSYIGALVNFTGTFVLVQK